MKRWRRLATGAALVVGAYPLAAWIGSSIPTNRAATPLSEGVQVLIASNGVHTAIVVPIANEDQDWRGLFPTTDAADPAQPYTDIALSWGERTVFLETATWADLKVSTVWHIVFGGTLGGGDSLVHVERFVRPAPDDDFRQLVLSHAQYRALAAAITRDVDPAARRIGGYGRNDTFYASRSRYSALHTCNTWVGEKLRSVGVPMGVWTPLAGGVMKWIPRPASH
ncbi:DUF2459 domain-containing protein [Novosphingobium sp.]|uniref:DUF2459 domain-containing protein n=1 Tax=Novosphingobium sp. TaxID=1874826 RepID=UPI0025F93C6A|nr:DUF2459 domain-containing protein [Novosphingobium sp.]